MTRAYKIETRDWYGCFYSVVTSSDGDELHATFVHSLRSDAQNAAQRWLRNYKAQAREQV